VKQLCIKLQFKQTNKMNNWKIGSALMFVIGMSFISHTGIAQTIKPSNIHFRIIEEKMEIFYDLPNNIDSINVRMVFRKESAPTFKYTPKFAYGNIGKGVFSGPQKKITWEYIKEPDYVFTGDGFYFDILITKLPARQKPASAKLSAQNDSLINRAKFEVVKDTALSITTDVETISENQKQQPVSLDTVLNSPTVVETTIENQNKQPAYTDTLTNRQTGGEILITKNEDADVKPPIMVQNEPVVVSGSLDKKVIVEGERPNSAGSNNLAINVALPGETGKNRPEEPKILIANQPVNNESMIDTNSFVASTVPLENKNHIIDDVSNSGIEKTNSRIGKSADNKIAGIQYERSSLSLLMVNDKSRAYSNVIEDAFTSYVIPEKFNANNIHIRTVEGESQKDNPEIFINDYLSRNEIAKNLVELWFNRNERGGFNMDLISERGRYNATEMEANISKMSKRGLALLSDAGEKLIGNTFIIVSDSKYVNKEEVANKIKTGFKIYNAAAAFIPGAPDLTKATSIASAGLTVVGKGYVVKTTSYLFRLVWNEEIANSFYTNYWTSGENPDYVKKTEFDKSNLFKLRYIGFEVSLADLQSTIYTQKSEEELIKIATIRGVDASIAKLERKYEEFRTKTPLLSGSPITAQIGLKEGLEDGDKFEVLEQVQDNEGKTYFKRVGVIKVDAENIWDNRYMAGEDNSTNKTVYTVFKGNGNFDKGMLIRQIN
jgi:hypothetical protein